ncbi:hypothetical protein AAMO2058_000002000 [Amorphochlora amoebiformis]
MSASAAIALALCALAPGANAAFEASTLVILDDPTVPQYHSIFFRNLKNRGHKVTFVSAKDRTLRLGKYGKYDYDNVILFSPQTEDFGGDFDVDHLVEFVESGRNALVIVDDDPTESNREFANECGVDFHKSGNMVIDHVSHDSAADDGLHTRVIAQIHPEAFPLLKKPISNPILYTGIAHTLNQQADLLTQVLTGGPSSYSSSPGTQAKNPQSLAEKTALVTAVQSRSSARILFAGSQDFFSNSFFNAVPVTDSATGKVYEKSGNEEFSQAITKWVFGEVGLFRAVNFTHKKLGSEELNPPVYTVKNDVVVNVVLQEYIASSDSWEPYKADDVQLEFTMLDPYIRTFMQYKSDGMYEATFKAPDRYGCFKFIVDYQRRGYTPIKIVEQISLRPFRHDEYERFLGVAYPYYASAFSMMAGFFVFGIYFLYGTIE